MTDAWLLLLGVCFPVITGLATLWLPRTAVTPRVLLALLGPAAAFVLIASCLKLDASASGEQATDAIAWLPDFHLDLAFLPDGLGGFFGLRVSGIGVLIVLYARGYFGGHTAQARDDLYRFLPTLGFFTTAMLGVVLADFTLLTLVFWELTSISSFLLIGWDRTKPGAVKLALQAFVTTGLGGMFLLGGIAVFGGATGVWRWSELSEASATIDWSSTPVVTAFALMLVGAFAKSAQWPLHYWLPGAMAAPTPVSAFLHSATMVKAGVFLVGRLYPEFQYVSDGTLWAAIIVPFGTVTMLYGGITAVCKHDLKQIFAYTTVSQLGLLMTMYGLGGLHYTHDGHHVAALDFDLTQIANHAFYKAPLFILAGAIGHVASRQLPDLFGAFKKHPAICGFMLAAAWALAALPGSISFQAKELFLYAVVHAAEQFPIVWAVFAATILTAACNVAIFVRLTTTLLGWRFGMTPAPEDEHAEHEHHDHEHGLGAALIWLPAVPLVALQFIGGIATPVWDALFLPFETHVHYAGFKGHVPNLIDAFTHPGVPLFASLLAIALGVVLGLSPLLRRPHQDVHNHIYPAAAWILETLGKLGRTLGQTGNLRHYLLFTFAFIIAGVIGSAIVKPEMLDALSIGFATLTENYVALFLGFLICLSAIIIPLTRSRVVRVLILGACGFAVVGMYVLFQAPDLALTQLFFEIISVLLFVLVLRMLPAERTYYNPTVWLRLPAAVLIGLAMGWITLVVAGANPDERLGAWFVENTYKGAKLADGTYGHGGAGFNIVNVILVDFRGFDTLGEVSVLGLAALGVWSMLAGRGRPLRQPREHRRLARKAALQQNKHTHPSSESPGQLPVFRVAPLGESASGEAGEKGGPNP
ncbi:MAG: hydrogen gas-evolving membrane-bound hydrogenase subunit E [Planctomycetota bacterium]